ncbi:MAG TPA: hypothetical protein PKD54_09130 [Pirellulaceae bacterium]|nr:hypothetical protein [Pirellulaceae bacterium]
MQSMFVNRRRFISDVGRGMLVAGLGYSVAHDLNFAPLWVEHDSPDRLNFGRHERLVTLVQETSADQLLPKLVDLVRAGTDVQELVAATALANARGFGGEDYVGFHAFMALMPAYRMALESPVERRALPVLKVIYRTAQRLQDSGRATSDALRPLGGEILPGDQHSTETIRQAMHNVDMVAAEHALAAALAQSPEQGWNALLPVIHEAPEVHRIVLAHRAWDMLSILGPEHAETMLRQSVRYCVLADSPRELHSNHVSELLARILEQHGLLEPQSIGTRQMDDRWIEAMVETLFTVAPEQAAGAIAEAISDGIGLEAVAEAISLAANLLVLRDPGRSPAEAGPNKPAGSVHGDSIGVHASDSAHAWRHVARFSNARNAAASLVLAGWHVAQDRTRRGNWDDKPMRPLPEITERIETVEPDKLRLQLDGAIRNQDQELACAIAARYLKLGHPPRPIFDVLLQYAISQDGALHAEKYYWTVVDEYEHTRPAFRDRHVIALARVTASQHGTPAPAYAEMCRLLGCD